MARPGGSETAGNAENAEFCLSRRSLWALGVLRGSYHRCDALNRCLCFCLLAIEAREEIGVSFRELAVDLEAGVGPAADPLAVVQIGALRGAIADVRLVIAAAGAQRPRPADLAVSLVADVMLLQERRLRVAIDAVPHRAELVRVRSRESMAQRDIAVSRHAQEP